MDNLIRKIKELEKEARRLKEECKEQFLSPQIFPNWSLQKNQHELLSPPRPTAARSLQILENGLHSSLPMQRSFELPESFEGDGDGDWLAVFKNEAGPWTGKKLVVLSLFDGIGGIWAALTRLGIPFVGYSSEVSIPAIQVVEAKFLEVHHVGDVRRLTRSAIPDDIDLIIGGFPCQDLSCMGKKEGLHGPRSKMFFDLLGVLKDFNPRWFLVENVASMTWIDRDEISKYLGVQPLELDSIELSPTRRKSLYWTNIPHPVRLPRVKDHPSTFVQSCLHNATALEEKAGVILSSNNHEGNRRQLELVMDKGTNNLRFRSHIELELIMGFQPHHTNILMKEGACSPDSLSLDLNEESSNIPIRDNKKGGSRGQVPLELEPFKATVRWMLLGNTFTVPVIAYLLSPLLKNSVREVSSSLHLAGHCLEKDCSAMEPNDVWALYNQHERPNWYALITKRSGDRFSRRNQTTGKKSPLSIEMQYMELVPSYLDGEEDTWNPLRGTGLYELRQEVDFQVSWTAFSHRVASFIRMFNKVFIFPGKDEVWSVYSRRTWSPFFVYVIESTININNIQSTAPGCEGFYARCYVVIKTGEHETYRRTDKVLEFYDLSVFCFRAPYNFKQEAKLLRVEVGMKGRKLRKIEAMIRRSKRKRAKSCDSLSEEDDEELEGDEAEILVEDDEEEMGKMVKEEAFLEEVAGTSANNYHEGRKEDDPPYRPHDDEEEEGNTENGTSTPETIIIDDD